MSATSAGAAVTSQEVFPSRNPGSPSSSNATVRHLSGPEGRPGCWSGLVTHLEQRVCSDTDNARYIQV